jgi:hypothetical protein
VTVIVLAAPVANGGVSWVGVAGGDLYVAGAATETGVTHGGLTFRSVPEECGEHLDEVRCHVQVCLLTEHMASAMSAATGSLCAKHRSTRR